MRQIVRAIRRDKNYRQFKEHILFGLEERQVAGNPKQKDDLPHGTAREQGYIFPRICVNLCSSVGGYIFPLIALIFTDMLRFSVYPSYPWDTTSART